VYMANNETSRVILLISAIFFGVMNYGSIEYLAIGTMRMRLLIFTETDHMQ
jgi:hypothetical protein